MPIDSLRALVARLSTPTYALSALGAALQAKSTGTPLPPIVQAQTDEVLAALDAAGALDGVTPAEARPLLGEIRFSLLHGVKRLSPGGYGHGWTSTEKEILQAAGEVSAGLPQMLKRIAPRMDGLSARLENPGGSFLDVGVGVAVLSIEMARLWPSLRVVGIDTWAPSLALARDNIAHAGLESRIELREQAIQSLPDVSAFDLIWLPSAFISERFIPEALQHVRRALRPGGWLLLAMMNPHPDPLISSLARLRTVEWGGSCMDRSLVEELLVQAGFSDVQAVPAAPTAIMGFLTARVES